MFFTKLSLMLASSMLLAAGPTAPAPTTAKPAAAVPGKRMERDGLCARIGCSESQAASLAKIFKATKEKLRAAHGKADDHNARLAAAMRDSKLTRAEAEAALSRGASHEARQDIMADALVQVHAVLDAKQRATLASTMETEGMRAVMGGHHGKGKGKGEGKAKGKGKGKAERGPDALKKAKRGGQAPAKR